MAKKKTAWRADSKKSAFKKTADTKPAAENKITYQTPRKLLLAPYAIIPASLLLVLIDQLFLGQWMQKHFPTLPEDLLFFVIFFNLPHITASTVTFLDHEYLKHYKWRIIIPAALLLAALLGFPDLIYSDNFTALLYLWTVIHVVGQQFGLTRILGAGFGKVYFFWKWTALLTGVLIYFGIYAADMKTVTPEVKHYILMGGWAMLLPFLSLSYFVYRPATTKLARTYVLGNTITIVCVVGLYTMHYPFFVILIPRVLHDFSAFIFYVSHDLNRNKHSAKNAVYRFFRFSRIPVYILCPVIAIGFAFPISYYAYLQNQDHEWQAWAYRLLIFITLLHYYTDSFVWKNGAMHREYIRLR